MKTVVDLNDALLREAIRFTGESNTSVLVDRALSEMVRRAKRMNLAPFAGKIDLLADLNTLCGRTL